MGEVSLQEAFDFMDKRIKSLEALSLVLIDLHKMTLRAFSDMELAESKNIAMALRELAEQHADDKFAASVLTTIASLHEGEEPDPDLRPHLQLVPKDPV